MFSFINNKELKKFKFNKYIYRPDDSDIDKHEFSTGLFGSPYDEFKDEFVKKNDDAALTNKVEKMTKRIYQTLESLYEF